MTGGTPRCALHFPEASREPVPLSRPFRAVVPAGGEALRNGRGRPAAGTTPPSRLRENHISREAAGSRCRGGGTKMAVPREGLAVLLLLLPLFLVIQAGAASGPLPAASSEAFDSVLGNTASCHRACQLTYPLHTYPKVRAGPPRHLRRFPAPPPGWHGPSFGPVPLQPRLLSKDRAFLV